MQPTHEIRTKIFGLYLGADICMPDWHTATIVSVGLDEFNSIEHSTGSYGIHHYNGEEKLLLHDLRDITDEQLKKLWMLLGKNPDFENEDFSIREYIMEYLTNIDKKIGSIELFDFKESAIIIDWLRANSFAVDYNGIDLFEAGIAKRKEV